MPNDITPRKGIKKGPATCKTCRPCRQKKVKCDGSRPSCTQCDASNLHCIYPRDNRRESRPSSARVQSLENTLTQLLEHMQAAGTSLPPGLQALHQLQQADSHPETDDGAVNENEIIPLPTPAGSENSPASSNFASAAPAAATSIVGHAQTGHLQNFVATHATVDSTSSAVNTDGNVPPAQWQGDEARYNIPIEDEDPGDLPHLSHCEARVAGVFHERGCVSSVHGLSGMINPNLRALHKKNISGLKRQGGHAVTESRARLISNAALQKQRETRLFRSPSELRDLDGCSPKMAEHLLGLHFNRYHYAYVLTYRPAFMDSLARGGGPFMNKLLLNAIYYSSTMYSDWDGMSCADDATESASKRFYERFKGLLANEIDRPTTATAAALLIMSGALISRGHSRAGWTFSGTAYRMITDLGCHMMIGSDHGDGQTTSQLLRVDMEREMRKRLYWGAYATDASQALYLGRPCMFACLEARVPLQLLDTLEEFEVWEPHNPIPNGEGHKYDAQPAHAVSTFMAMIQLLKISTKITDLYGIQSIKLNTDTLLEKWRSIEWELDKWKTSLPPHLFMDSEITYVPPPHQITPHTTYHALTILLHRAFLEEGHHRRHSTEADKRRAATACIRSALAIQSYARKYRETFTLRRAPFLLSYAVYSAVSAILHQEQSVRRQHAETISFFWTCLNELHRGSGFGLKKTLSILQDMIRELQVSVEDGIPEQALQPSLDESAFRMFDLDHGVGNADLSGHSDWGMSDSQLLYGVSPVGDLTFMNEQERGISGDALYGLFAPSQRFA